MTLRRAHGKGARTALVRVETLPFDELPAGVPAPARPVSPDDRPSGRKFARGSKYTADMAAAGGRARAGKTRLASELSLSSLDADPAFAPYKRAADAFRVAHCREIAESVGGGLCGSGPSSFVASAALALGASRFIYDTANGDADMFLKAAALADKSRIALASAHEYAAKEAASRPKAKNVLPWKIPPAPPKESA